MFDQFASETGAVVRVYHVPGCGVLALNASMADVSGGTCRQPTKSALEDTASLLRPGDVVFLPSLRVNRFSDQWVRFDERVARAEMTSQSSIEARTRAAVEAKTWLSIFAEKGAQTVFEYPKPVFRSPPFRCADYFNRSNKICDSGLTLNREDFLNYRLPVVAAIDSLAASNASVSAWDPLPALCPEGTCNAYRGTTPLYYDGDHVSAAGNRLLFPSFKEAVCKRAPLGRC
jgi:SGNH domain (fused to AT3 domains)